MRPNIVIRTEIDADVATYPPYQITEFEAAELIKDKTNALQPTHELRYYLKKKKYVLLKRERAQHGNTVVFKDKKEISMQEVKKL